MVHDLYVEVEKIVRKFLPKGVHFYYLCGGRGIGKTYGGIDFIRKISLGEFVIDPDEPEQKFIYLRRRNVETQAMASKEGNAFKKYNKGEKTEMFTDYNTTLGFGEIYDNTIIEEERGKPKLLGYASSVSTFDNLTGIDFSDVVCIFYDECLPRNRNKAPIKGEGFVFLNMIETINRNRKMEGKQEVIVIMLSNPTDLSSPFLSQLVITPILNNMILRGQQTYTDYKRSLHIEKYVDHEVSEQKSEGVLYKFAEPTGFNEEALSGDFVKNDLSIIEKINYTEYYPYLVLENICVYRHKSLEKWHISSKCMPAKYNFKVYEREKFREVFYWKYKTLVIDRLITYDNFNTQTIFNEMIRYKPLPAI